MKKIFDKKTVFSFILGILLCSGIVYGVNTYQSETIQYSPTDSNWNVSNVNNALNDLYDNTIIGDAKAEEILQGKTALVQGKLVQGTLKKGGYVALFSGKSSISTSTTTVPNIYFDTTFGSKSGNTITLNIPGNYRIIGTAAHSPANNYCTSHLRLYINGSNTNTCGNNHVSYWTINRVLTINENETYTINATMDSDGNMSGIRGGTMVIIKES